MAVNDVYKLSIVGTFGLGQTFVNTIHYKQLQAVLIPSAESLGAMFNDQVMEGYLDLLMNSSVVNVIETREVTPPGEEGFDTVVNLPGHLTGEQLPPMNAPLISWRTGLVGRKNRGRMYLPAPNEVSQASGALTSGYVTNAQIVADNMITLLDVVDPVWQAVIWHSVDGTSTPITTAIIRLDIATQRRRRVGTGA